MQQDSALLVERLRAVRQWISEAGDPLATFRVMTWLARAYIEAGQLRQAHRECLSALNLLEQTGGSTLVVGYLLASLFDISYAWNRLEEATGWLHRLHRFAQKALRNAEALLAQEEFANNARWVAETRVQVWLASGKLAEASTWAAQTTLSPHDWDLTQVGF